MQKRRRPNFNIRHAFTFFGAIFLIALAILSVAIVMA
jgi:hypothetical protein